MGLLHLWSLLLAASCFSSLAYSKNVNQIRESSLGIDLENNSSFCCEFDTESCGFSYNTGTPRSWYWSVDGALPDPKLFPSFSSSSDYLWTQNADQATTNSPDLSNIDSTTEFGFQYFAHFDDASSHATVYLSFYDATPDVELDTLNSTDDVWIRHSITCGTTCCAPYPCDGFIKIVVDVTEYNSLFAIDNTEVNSGCASIPIPTTTTPVPTPPRPGCCDFSEGACGFDYSVPPTPGFWDYSAEGYSPNATVFPLFETTSEYIFTQNDDGSTTYSELFDTLSTTKISFTYYAHVEDPTGSSALYVYFENSDGTPATIIDIVGDSGDSWLTRSLTCASRNCCATYPCTGRIKIVAGAVSKNELYAINHIEFNDECCKNYSLFTHL